MYRTVKSYVLRAGRMSPRQREGLLKRLEAFELKCSNIPWDLPSIFGREADTMVEIGFGMGASLLAMAKARPDVNFIGVEVHQAGIGSLAAQLYEQDIHNIRIAPFDAVDLFKTCLQDETLAGVQIFFPDPWPKKRHHKRRLIQPAFIKTLSATIKPGGILHCATDWESYAHHMLSVLNDEPRLKNQQTEGEFTPRPAERPLTKFEARGHGLGHQVWDLIFVRLP